MSRNFNIVTIKLCERQMTMNENGAEHTQKISTINAERLDVVVIVECEIVLYFDKNFPLMATATNAAYMCECVNKCVYA